LSLTYTVIVSQLYSYWHSLE